MGDRLQYGVAGVKRPRGPGTFSPAFFFNAQQNLGNDPRCEEGEHAVMRSRF